MKTEESIAIDPEAAKKGRPILWLFGWGPWQPGPQGQPVITSKHYGFTVVFLKDEEKVLTSGQRLAKLIEELLNCCTEHPYGVELVGSSTELEIPLPSGLQEFRLEERRKSHRLVCRKSSG